MDGHFYCCQPVLKGTPVIKLHHLILPDIMDKRTLRWPLKARQPTCSIKWSLRVKMLEQSWNWWLWLMTYVHCNSEINSIEKDTVYIQFYDCLYKYTACFAHLLSLTVCSIVFCLSHLISFCLICVELISLIWFLQDLQRVNLWYNLMFMVLW